MRRFLLDRIKDLTGVSGTGVVAEGVQFADGTVVVRWRGETKTTTVHESLESVERVHLHGGATRFLWLDCSWDGPRPCEIWRTGQEPEPGVSPPTERLHDGWTEPNGATDINGAALFIGQRVRLVGAHGEVSDEGEVTDLYVSHGVVRASLLGADCGPTAYKLENIEAIDKTTKDVIHRHGRKPTYGWAPTLTIGGES